MALPPIVEKPQRERKSRAAALKRVQEAAKKLTW